MTRSATAAESAPGAPKQDSEAPAAALLGAAAAWEVAEYERAQSIPAEALHRMAEL